MRYSAERQAAVLKKLLPPHNRALKDLVAEEGISEATPHLWRKAGSAACEQAKDWWQAQAARLQQATRAAKRRLQALERELTRKDQALTETAA